MGSPEASRGWSDEPLKVVEVVQCDEGAGEMEAVNEDVLVAALPDSIDVRVVVTIVTVEHVCASAFADDVLLLAIFTLYIIITESAAYFGVEKEEEMYLEHVFLWLANPAPIPPPTPPAINTQSKTTIPQNTPTDRPRIF